MCCNKINKSLIYVIVCKLKVDDSLPRLRLVFPPGHFSRAETLPFCKVPKCTICHNQKSLPNVLNQCAQELKKIYKILSFL